jgi:hypothetical protein
MKAKRRGKPRRFLDVTAMHAISEMLRFARFRTNTETVANHILKATKYKT